MMSPSLVWQSTYGWRTSLRTGGLLGGLLCLTFGVCPSHLAAAADPAAAPRPGVTMATIGDSLSTGAVTHPALAFDGRVLWDIFNGSVTVSAKVADLPNGFNNGLVDPLPAPQRLWPTSREFFGGPDWIWRNALQSISRSYLDTVEYSWGYLLALRLGVPPAQLAIGGEDGARVERMSRHIDRVLEANGGVLPPRLVIFYTGNDLCGASMAEVTSAEDYGQDVERGLRYLLRNAKAAPGGSDIYLAAHMNILQLLTSESILAKKVRAFGGESTCRDLRQRGFRPTAEQAEALRTKPVSGDAANSPEAWYFSLVMPPSPAGFCTTLFSPGEGRAHEEEVHALANRIRSFREQQVQALQRVTTAQTAKAGEVGAPALRLHFLEETGRVKFLGEDIGQDCFHLSILGQAKVAEAMLSGINGVEGKLKAN